MKKIMVMGRVSCGKTTLCRYFAGLSPESPKTQAVELVGEAIDTPGEYTENRKLFQGLLATSADVSAVLLLQSITDCQNSFSPGQASMFGRPVIGVVTKLDAAGDICAVEQAEALLTYAGAEPVFRVSAKTGTGMEQLRKYLEGL